MNLFEIKMATAAGLHCCVGAYVSRISHWHRRLSDKSEWRSQSGNGYWVRTSAVTMTTFRRFRWRICVGAVIDNGKSDLMPSFGFGEFCVRRNKLKDIYDMMKPALVWLSDVLWKREFPFYVV